MEEVSRHHEHVSSTNFEFNNMTRLSYHSKERTEDPMTPCQCLTTTGDLFFDVLAKIDVVNSIKVINYMLQKISHHIIHRHLMENTVLNSQPPTSSRIQWINLLQGFSSSLHPSDLFSLTLSLLTLVDILENVQKCLLGKHNRETFHLLVQLLTSMSQFQELQDDDENQQIIFELQQEANAQELICQHRSRGNESGNVEMLCEAHPLPEFCERIKVFVSSLIREKGRNLEAKILDGEHLKFSEPQEQVEKGAFEGEDDPEEQMNLLVEQTPEPFDESGHDPVHVEPFQPPPQPQQDATVESSMSPENEKAPPVCTGTSRRKNRRVNYKDGKTKRKWSTTEESYLIKGVEQFGVRNWARILNTYKFEGRTGGDLSNKWLQMEKKRGTSHKDQQVYCKELLNYHWSATEEEKMRKGVERFGVGKWTKIINTYKFEGRTRPALYHKWQRMEKKRAQHTTSSCYEPRQSTSLRYCWSRTQQYRKWTPTEEENLRKGVEQFGLGNWTEILNTYKFQDRTELALDRKWHYMEIKRGSGPPRREILNASMKES